MKRTAFVSLFLSFCFLFSCLIPTTFVRAADAPKRSYIIVLGTDALKQSAGLKQFVDYKSTSFEVTVVSMPDIAKQFPTVTDKVEQLRQYLGTKTQPVPPYVLLVGDLTSIPSALFCDDTLQPLGYYETNAPLEFNKPLSYFDKNGNGKAGETKGDNLRSLIPMLKSCFVIGRIPSDDSVFLDKYFTVLIAAEKKYVANPSIKGLLACATISVPRDGSTGYMTDTIGEDIKLELTNADWTTLYEKEGNFVSSFACKPLNTTNFVNAWNEGVDIVYTNGHNGNVRIVWQDANHDNQVSENEVEHLTFYSSKSSFTNSVYLGWMDGCYTIDYNGVVSSINLRLFLSGKLINYVGATGQIVGAIQAPSPIHAFEYLGQGYSIGDAMRLAKAQATASNGIEFYEFGLIGDPSVRVNNKIPAQPVVQIEKAFDIGRAIDINWTHTDLVFGYEIEINDSLSNTVESSFVDASNTEYLTSLKQGAYTCRIRSIYDTGAGGWAQASFMVIPHCELSIDPLPYTVNSSPIFVSGTTNGTRVTVNGKAAIVKDGRFSFATALQFGSNAITVAAQDDYGQSNTQTVTVNFEHQLIITLKINSYQMRVGDSTVTLDSPPVIQNSRTLVPLRAITEAAGGTIDWNASIRQATIQSHGIILVLIIGKSQANLNGKSVPIDSSNPKVVPIIINGRTMLPLRFVAESLGFQVDWEPTTQTIVLTYSGS